MNTGFKNNYSVMELKFFLKIRMLNKINILILLILISNRLDSQSYTTSYQYDATNQLSQITYSDGSASFLQYDETGNQTNQVYSVDGSNPLSVELISFNAEHLGMDAFLTFQTASETNNSGFIIQRSFNAFQFDSIGFVKGNGNSNQIKNYRYLDFQPTQGKSGIVYYRLKQIDYDGKFELSSIKAVVFKFEDFEVLVYPNPTHDIINIQISDSSVYNLEVYNLSGQQCLKSKISGNTTLNLNDLPKGVYFIRLYNFKSSIYRKIILN